MFYLDAGPSPSRQRHATQYETLKGWMAYHLFLATSSTVDEVSSQTDEGFSGLVRHSWPAAMNFPSSSSDDADDCDDELSGWEDLDEYRWLHGGIGSSSDDDDDNLSSEEWEASDDDESERDGWWSGSSEDEEPYMDDIRNMEVPVSFVNGGTELADADAESGSEADHSSHLMLYFVGDELGGGDEPGDGGDSGRTAGSAVESVPRVGLSLPREVVEEVLLRLPASSQARCRAVCKASLAMLSSEEFLQRNFFHALSLVSPPICAFSFCVSYDDDDSDEEMEAEFQRRSVRAPRHKASKMDLSFLPKVFHNRMTEVHSCSPSGLMCVGLIRHRKQEVHLCVLNPINRSFKVLPMLNCSMGGRAILVVDSSTCTVSPDQVSSFKVYLSSEGSYSREFVVYCSRSAQWRRFQCEPCNFLELADEAEYGEGEENCNVPLACNGALYTVVRSTRPRLVRLSMESGQRYLWDLTLPFFEKHHDLEWMGEFYLADYRGRLLCCCGGIWMLDDVAHQWIEIAQRCPAEVLPPCNPAKHTLTLEKVQVAGDLVVHFHELVTRRGKSCSTEYYPVAYNMLRRCWQKVPEAIGTVGQLFQAMPNLRF